MTIPISPDERAALRERYTADLPIAWNMPAAAHARALRDLGRSAREVVPRLLDALAIAEAERNGARGRVTIAEAERNGARGRVRTTKDELRRVDNFLRLEREAARENLTRAEKAEAELARLREETAAFINEVQAEALHDAARAAVSDSDDCIPWSHDHDRATVATWLRARADRLKKRADRG